MADGERDQAGGMRTEMPRDWCGHDNDVPLGALCPACVAEMVVAKDARIRELEDAARAVVDDWSEEDRRLGEMHGVVRRSKIDALRALLSDDRYTPSEGGR